MQLTPSLRGESLNNPGAGYMNGLYAREFWRFVPGMTDAPSGILER